jgi:CubicO group peptidase (beta-lactamase class C family)
LPRELFLIAVVIAVFLGAILPTSRTAFAQTVNIDRAVAELEPDIQRALLEGKIPSAAIALIAGDRVIWTGAYGYSNLWARTPATTSTVYLIGSTFKAMSTVALLQQMEQGKFKLDDRVNDYLTDFKIQNEDPQHPVTFRHLLTHTSGLPGDFGPFPLWGDASPPPLEEYLRKSLKVAKPPMTSVVYSNMAYALIGYLVQKFSGVPYKQYIQEHIFTPLEMTSTAFEPRPDMDERLSVPYTVDEKSGGQTPALRLKASAWPAGIVYGTSKQSAAKLASYHATRVGGAADSRASRVGGAANSRMTVAPGTCLTVTRLTPSRQTLCRLLAQQDEEVGQIEQRLGEDSPFSGECGGR